MFNDLNKLPRYVIEHIAKRIAGEIVLSNEPGKIIRKWREIYGLNQLDVAKLMRVNPSVLSDYERERRSAGRKFIKRFVEVLLEYDSKHGWNITRYIAKLFNIYVEGVIDLGEFIEPITLDELVILSEGILLSPSTLHRPIRGYTVLDSVRVVKALTANEYVKVMGATNDRVVVFTNITRGRSVMVATRVSPVKPSVIILHGIKNIDPLAIHIAILENIPLIHSLIDINTLINRFREKTLL